MNKDNYVFHITYNERMTLKKLIEVLNTVNTSINDYYRNNKVNNNSIGQYAPVVEKVENGSILLDIGIAVFSGLTTNVLVELLQHRIRKQKNANSKKDEEINNIQIQAGDNNTINIHIG